MFEDSAGGKKQPVKDPEERSWLRTVPRFSWIIVLIVAVGVAWIFYSRWQENQDIAAKMAREKREHAREVVEGMGGTSFEIINFYAAPGAIRRGDEAELCYGVSNAKSVSIEPPPADGVWPSLDRCVSISPEKTTTYTLTAVDATGKEKTQSLTVTVR